MHFDPYRVRIGTGCLPDQQLLKERLYKAISRDLIVFVGAGVSAAVDQPTWIGIARSLTERALAESSKMEERQRIAHILGLLPMPGLDIPAALDQLPGAESLHKQVPELLQNAKSQKLYPLDPLFSLPIGRYITTNYDLAIEQNLEKATGIRADSFTQAAKHRDKIIRFLLGKMATPAIFHCHGSIDSNEEDTIVLTESHYRKWYLQDDECGAAVREVFPAILASSPVLFIGFSLSDYDLLRPLRLLHASDRSIAANRPLFALISGPDDRAVQAKEINIAALYGVDVIRYESSPDSSDYGLRAALQQIADGYEDWQQRRVEKPLLRKVIVSASRARKEVADKLYRFVTDTTTEEEFFRCTTRDSVKRIIETLNSRRPGRGPTVVLLGPGGIGKSVLAKELGEAFDGAVFFWSSYYADDWISFLERLTLFLSEHGRPFDDRSLEPYRETRLLDRLHSQLEDQPGRKSVLVVLDGLERLLLKTDAPEIGKPYSKDVQRLLAILTSESADIQLVITSRLWPMVNPDSAEIHPFEGEQPIVCWKMSGLTGDQVKLFFPKDIGEDRCLAFASLVDGHAYSVVLASRMLETQLTTKARLKTADRILRTLVDVSPNECPAAVVRMAIDMATAEDSKLRNLLQSAAVFMAPVERQTLHICGRHCGFTDAGTDKAIQRFEAASLLLPIKPGVPSNTPRLFSIHPIIRGYVFSNSEGIGTDHLPVVSMSGFTSATYAEFPGRDLASIQMTQSLYERFREEAEKMDRPSVQQCRAAFGVLRSRMDSNAIPRWWDYPSYSQLLSEMITIARKTSAAPLWTFRDPSQYQSLQHDEAPLYAEELAWLYNDLGLACCSEGDMNDAIDVWKQGYELNYMIEGGASGQFVVQSQLHLAHAFLELGRLDQAMHYLEESRASNAKLGDPDLACRIDGYTALVHHLQGSISLAHRLYVDVEARLAAGGNRRALSIFRRNLADLLIKTGELGEASRKASDSLADALQADYPDLAAFCNCTFGHIMRERREYEKSSWHYERALTSAKQFGIWRLQADTLAEQSRLALMVGDFESARRRAQKAMIIALQKGLGLRQTHALVVLGQASVKCGSPELGRSYLLLALELAQKQTYHSRAQEAEDHLRLVTHGGHGF